jgi:tetratricopeptide (TPR) repeat protein
LAAADLCIPEFQFKHEQHFPEQSMPLRQWQAVQAMLWRRKPRDRFATNLRDIMLSALACQRRGDLPGAEALYRQALTLQPDEPDCLHMLGVVCYETGRNREAYELVYRALSLTGWRIESMRHNMALVLVKLLAYADTGNARSVQQRYVEFCRERDARRLDRDPLVSIVIPSFNHGNWIQRALESVYCQTYRRLEVVVIDDGSSDGSPEIIRESLSRCPFPCRLVVRENRGAHARSTRGSRLQRESM